ncbi:dTDP-4-dehydrorhamnose 3,5-epimerase [Dyadobacter sp. CY261]|uniref:dTDP-4-dehydrorhamnose 3,5-epimerase n=1 Tax=Dyadobacter sp. CY261 TaxID=2907203 RepID=UPI001F2440E4|nr:dTDP-4-dehydrorhamnose 3,5-epimerase [Dyadobacter sp. CY261]MCF0075137.1 dTDP-4-dehydrorhamnose 3,5-epimerase [Dyadobacter sp. CY261]
MKIKQCSLRDVLILEPSVFGDERGHFYESFNKNAWESLGLPTDFVQDNQSFSKSGVIRGLHFQHAPYAQGKLVRVLSGRVIDVAVDLREESPTFGQYELFDLDAVGGRMVYIPAGFAHGFAAIQDSVFYYKCTAPYHKASEGGILWNDPTLNIPWDVKNPIVSDKDQVLPTFDEIMRIA